MSKKKDSLKPWLSRPAINRSVTLPLTRPLTQRLSNLNEFHPNELDPYLLFDARDSMIGTLENPTLDLDPSKPDSLNVITATRAGVATYTDVNGNIAPASADTVRVDYTQGAELTPTVYQRIGYTDFSSGWTADSVSKQSGNGYLSEPSAIITIDSTSSAKYYYFLDAGTYNYDTVYTGSFFIRRVSGTPDVYIDSFRSTSSESASISLTDDWQKIEFTFTSPSDYWARFGISFGAANSSVGDQVEISQPQVEEGTTASSFVANTTGSPKFITGATYADRVPMILVEPSATNLLPYSEDFSQSAWVKDDTSVTSNAGTAPDGSNNASLVTVNSASVSYLREFFTISATAHTFSIYAKAGTATDIQLYVVEQGITSGTADVNIESGAVTNVTSNWNGGVTTEDVGNGWFRIKGTRNFTTSAPNHGIGIAATGQNGLNFYIWGAQVEAGSVATSLIPTSGGDAAARTRAADDLSIDPDATNHITNTDFSTWVAQRMTVASGGGYAGRPSSIITAIESTGNKFLRSTLSGVTAGQTHTASIYVRRVSGSGSVQFEHQSSTSGADQNVTSQVGSDWTRIDTQFNGSTSGGVVTSFAVRLFTEGDALEIAMPQVELGSDPTGFIPTSGAAASRTTFSDFYNASEGTFYMEANVLDNGLITSPHIFEVSDGTTNNRIKMHINTSNEFTFRPQISGSNVFSRLLGSVGYGSLDRIAVSYKTNNYVSSLNGTSDATDTGAVPSNQTQFVIGGSVQSDPRNITGRIKRLIYWPYHSDSL